MKKQPVQEKENPDHIPVWIFARWYHNANIEGTEENPDWRPAGPGPDWDLGSGLITHSYKKEPSFKPVPRAGLWLWITLRGTEHPA